MVIPTGACTCPLLVRLVPFARQRRKLWRIRSRSMFDRGDVPVVQVVCLPVVVHDRGSDLRIQSFVLQWKVC